MCSCKLWHPSCKMQEHICLLSSPVPSFGLGVFSRNTHLSIQHRVSAWIFHVQQCGDCFECSDFVNDNISAGCEKTFSLSNYSKTAADGAEQITVGHTCFAQKWFYWRRLLCCPCSREHLNCKPTILSETYLCGFELCEQHNYTHCYLGAKLFCTNRGAHAV